MPKGFQVACTRPHLALRHMFSDTEYFTVLGLSSQTKGGCCSLVGYSEGLIISLMISGRLPLLRIP